ncbi:thiamine pyrophosphate-binding protein [Halanaeroarchaeum sulfurireducens]|uniref:Thiamine pyrophosphate domain-containing TPP-binding protein n=1 Tax=Halanaeroarchaeum sulfurireducens TaxID=1604004 RepID=A0A0F7PBP9_9EURY|nr:thiamine pyrophosphate-binding protein [Halanaeroarchaeum sulfurireducens]AKH98117.1 thiamine pyrophosphate domain-containing TPP-binding protein [Halanaeroarchaeum sulfurireducens]
MADAYTGADLFVEALERYGVEHVFGNPGTTELPILEALADGDLEYVLGLHEDIAVGMAAGYAQTRRYHSHHADVLPAGVVNLHVTPGLAHGLANVYAASFTGAPLVVTAGNHERDFRHEEPILHGDLAAMVDQFTKWSDEVLAVDALPTMVRRAFRVALTPPTGPVFLALPADVMRSVTRPDAIEPLGPIPSAGRGDPTQIDHAVDVLVNADEPVLILGDAVARSGTDAVDAAVAFAEAAGTRVHAEILSSEVTFPTRHDQWVSHLPLREGDASMLMDTDTIVFVGTSTNTTLLPHDDELLDPDTAVVHVGDDAWEVGKNHPVDAPIVGDPGLVLDELADRLQEGLPASERERRIERVKEVKQSLEPTFESMSVDEKPEGETRAGKHELVDALSDVAGAAYIVDEGITAKAPLLLRYDMEPEGFISNKGGGLGYGLPAAVGAALAESQRDDPRDVVGYVGDGSYLYYPQAIYSAARYDLDLTVVVPDNRNYRILKDNALELFGGPEADRNFVGMDFDPPVDIVTNAESHGARGHLVETPAEIAPTLETALEASGVDVVDVLVHD